MLMIRAIVMTAALALAGATEAPRLTALAGLETGQWALRAAQPGAQPRLLCIGDPRVFLQIQHEGALCSRFVIANEPTITTVQYTCPGAGHGRTTVRVETPRLIHIDSQGIAANAPFNWSLEGRRVGACPATAAR